MALGKSLGNILTDYFGEETELGLDRDMLVQEISVADIKITKHQTREMFDQSMIESLAESIKELGLIHPVTLLQEADHKYTLLSGERRLRAIKYLGRNTVPALVMSYNSLTEEQKALITVAENLQRENLSALELAKTYKMLMQVKKVTESELAKSMNVTTQYIRNYLRLLKTSPKVQKALLEHKIGEGQARYLVLLDYSVQDKILIDIIEKQLTVKQIQEIIQKIKPAKKKLSKYKNLELLPKNIQPKLEKILKSLPNSQIKIKNLNGKNRIIINWIDQEI